MSTRRSPRLEITLPADLLRYLDERLAPTYMSRSAAIASLLRGHMHGQRYADPAETPTSRQAKQPAEPRGKRRR